MMTEKIDLTPTVPVFESNCNTAPDFCADPDNYQNKNNENAEPTSRCLSGTKDFWAAEEWAEPVVTPDGRSATKYYLFAAEDVTDDDGNQIDADCYPWDAEHVSRIVVDDQQSITADEENGCEICWEIARQIADVDSGTVSAEEYKRLKNAVGRCAHGAPDYAKSIFVEFQS